MCVQASVCVHACHYNLILLLIDLLCTSSTDKTPSDVGLCNVAIEIGSCHYLAVKLGIPLFHVDDIPDTPCKDCVPQHTGGMGSVTAPLL